MFKSIDLNAFLVTKVIIFYIVMCVFAYSMYLEDKEELEGFVVKSKEEYFAGYDSYVQDMEAERKKLEKDLERNGTVPFLLFIVCLFSAAYGVYQFIQLVLSRYIIKKIFFRSSNASASSSELD